jgi:small subunit ribosomal protein S17
MAKKEVREIGIPDVAAPSETCTDVNCPFHGKLGVRGRIFTGVVMSTKPNKTAIVGWERRTFLNKYERFEKRKSKVFVHAPPCLHVHKDDEVIIGECRPISKSKKFVIFKKVEAKQ